MNRDDIIRMVNKAGGGQLSDRQFQLHGLDTITNFANLVASAEREACADAVAQIVMTPTLTHGVLVKLSDVVNAIRARGQA